MARVTATRAAREFSDLLNRVCYQGVSFEVERGSRVVARIVPASPASRATVADLAQIFAELPRLGDDAEAFEAEMGALRRAIPPEEDPWG